MKQLKFPMMAFLFAGLFTLAFLGCKKEKNDPSVTSDAGKPSGGSESCTGYEVTLSSSYDGVNTTFTWKIVNPKPGNGSNGTIQNLSHWTFDATGCLETYWASVISASYKYGDAAEFTLISPTPQIKPDPSQKCTTANVFKFDFGTSATTATYYQLVLSGNWSTAKHTAYFKSGTNTGCCSKEVDGVGCPVLEDCSLSQGYYFAKPEVVWPFAVVLDGESYTKTDGDAIWNYSNKGGINDSKKAFTQYAAINLSQVDLSTDLLLAADMKIIEDYFATLTKKLSPTAPVYMPTGTAASILAAGAAGRIGDWINAHHCED